MSPGPSTTAVMLQRRGRQKRANNNHQFRRGQGCACRNMDQHAKADCLHAICLSSLDYAGVRGECWNTVPLPTPINIEVVSEIAALLWRPRNSHRFDPRQSPRVVRKSSDELCTSTVGAFRRNATPTVLECGSPAVFASARATQLDRRLRHSDASAPPRSRTATTAASLA